VFFSGVVVDHDDGFSGRGKRDIPAARLTVDQGDGRKLVDMSGTEPDRFNIQHFFKSSVLLPSQNSPIGYGGGRSPSACSRRYWSAQLPGQRVGSRGGCEALSATVISPGRPLTVKLLSLIHCALFTSTILEKVFYKFLVLRKLYINHEGHEEKYKML